MIDHLDPSDHEAIAAVSGGDGAIAERVVIRDATAADLPAVVHLYADDMIGAGREREGEPLDPVYRRGFDAVAADPRNRLMVAELDGRVVGTLQFTTIPGVSRRGGERAQVDAVHVAPEVRGRRIGHRLAEWALDEARRQGCALVQLTSDLRRGDAHRFWASLGFQHTHAGMKLLFQPPSE